MMKHYTTPEIKISTFSKEAVSTTAETLASQAGYTDAMNNFIDSTNGRNVQRNLNFNDAIKLN